MDTIKKGIISLSMLTIAYLMIGFMLFILIKIFAKIIGMI